MALYGKESRLLKEDQYARQWGPTKSTLYKINFGPQGMETTGQDETVRITFHDGSTMPCRANFVTSHTARFNLYLDLGDFHVTAVDTISSSPFTAIRRGDATPCKEDA